MARRQTSEPSLPVHNRTRRPEHLTEQRATPPIVELRRDARSTPAARRPRAGEPARRPRRVRLPGRPHRLRQVDPDQAPDPRAGADRGRGADRRPRHRHASRQEAVPTCAAGSAPSSRTSSCSPSRNVYDNVAYALQVIGASRGRRSAPRSPTRCAWSASRTRSRASPTSSPAASSSGSRSLAPLSTTRRCCSPTSRPATSIRRPRSGSCRRSTGSTAPAPRCGGHPRPRDGGQDAPARDRPRRRPGRARPGCRHVHPTRSPPASSRPAFGRDGRRGGAALLGRAHGAALLLHR